MREDKGKVPDDFPEMRAISHIGSEKGRPYKPYYRAREVWKYFAELTNDSDQSPKLNLHKEKKKCSQ